MGKKIRTRIPASPSNLNPSWPYLEQFREKDASLKGRQKRDFDKKVEGSCPPRSYTVKAPKGQLRRNRRHLNGFPETPNTDTSTALSSPSPDVQTAASPEPTAPATASSTPVIPKRTTRGGLEIRLPERFKDSCIMSIQQPVTADIFEFMIRTLIIKDIVRF